MERIPIGIENVLPSFNLIERLCGLNNGNWEYIESQTGSKISLEGVGSAGELAGPLYIRIENDDEEELHEARKLVVSLVNTVREDHRALRLLVKSELSSGSSSHSPGSTSCMGPDPSLTSSSVNKSVGPFNVKSEPLDCDGIKKEIEEIHDNNGNGFSQPLEKRRKVDRRKFENQPNTSSQSDKKENSNINKEKLKQTIVQYGSKYLHLTVMPENINSLYGSVAHLLQEQYLFSLKVTRKAKLLQECCVNYIRDHKTEFFSHVIELANRIFPELRHLPDEAFEKCCQYLEDTDNSEIEVPLMSIASMTGTPIVVIYEHGRKSVRFNPIGNTLETEQPPISIFCHTDNKTFDSIEEWVSPENLNDAHKKVNPISKPNDKQVAFVVATYMADGNYSYERKETIDKYLVDHNVDVACILGMMSSNRNVRVETEMGKTYTSHYNWHSTATLNCKGDVTLCILVRKKSQALLSSFKIYSNMVASAVVNVNNEQFTITSCHLTKETNKRFGVILADLMHALSDVPATHSSLLMGTFTGKVLANNPSETGNTGPETLQPLSGNGEMLKSLAVRYRLRVVSPFIKNDQDDLDKGTYIFLQSNSLRKTSSFHSRKPLSNQPIVGCKIIV